MNDIAIVFSQIITYGIQAGWVVPALMALRLILKKCPRYIICALWALVALRLIFPFNIQSIFSLVPETSDITRPVDYYTTKAVRQVFPEIDSTPLMTAGGMQSNSNIGSGDVVGAHLFYITTLIWMIGVGIMLAYALMSYIRLYRLTRENIKTDDGIYLCDRIPSPFILGIIRPKIFLPSNISEHDKPYVLAHEKAHIKRCDHLWKPLGFLLLSVYWFNPLLWIAYVLLCKDIELACDEKVIKELGFEVKKPYAIALINSAAPRRLISACPLAFGETSVKSRIKNVLNYKKPAFWIIIVAVVLSIAVAVCFLTNPIDNKDEPDSAAAVSPTETLLTKLETYEAVEQFFKTNADRFPKNPANQDKWTWANVKEEYYGGTYIDGAVQVILLTDISKMDQFTDIGIDIRYEQCLYTYEEMKDALKEINSHIGPLVESNEGYSTDVIGMSLDERLNRVVIDIYQINNEKTAWFKEQFGDMEFYAFRDTEYLPKNDELDSMTVSTNLPTLTYADEQYIYLDGDCGVVIYDIKNAKLINRIPVSQFQRLGYTTPYSYTSADGKRITIKNYGDDNYFPFIEYDASTGEIKAFSTDESLINNDISDDVFEFDGQYYDIKYDEDGRNTTERIYHKGGVEYRLSVPGWEIKNTTVTIKKPGVSIVSEYHIFDETTLDGKNIFLD